jgi:four helix bundle protein
MHSALGSLCATLQQLSGVCNVGTITQFEDIEAWRKARELTRSIYDITANGSFARDFGLRDQIRRASVSIMSNIAEGFERDGTTEFRQFLSIAKGSVGEVKAQLYVALDAGLIDQQQFGELYKLTHETGRLIGGFMRYLHATEHRGNKFK